MNKLNFENFVYYDTYEKLENCRSLQCKTIYGFWHEIIEQKFGLDLSLMQETTVHEWWWTMEKDQVISKEIRTEQTKQEKMTQKKKKNGWRTITPRTVLILGGKDVMSLLSTPKQIAILSVIVCGFPGEELKAKAPPGGTWMLGDLHPKP